MGDIRKLIYGIAIASFVMVVIIIAMADGSSKYGASYDEDDFEKYDRLDEINNISKDIRSNSNTSLSSNPLDVLGEFFKTGYSTIKLTSTTVDIADEMSGDAIKDANLGESGEKFKILVGALIVFFVIGTIVAIAVGRDW